MIAVATLLLVAMPAHAHMIHAAYELKCETLTKDPAAFDAGAAYISGFFDALDLEKHVRTPQFGDIPDIIDVTCRQHPDFNVIDIAELYARTMR
jgi:hypothetical protein